MKADEGDAEHGSQRTPYPCLRMSQGQLPQHGAAIPLSTRTHHQAFLLTPFPTSGIPHHSPVICQPLPQCLEVPGGEQGGITPILQEHL